MWLKLGIPVLVLLGVVGARVVYYVFWRKHWDRRPGRQRRVEPTEIVIIRETQSHLDGHTRTSPRGGVADPNDADR